MILDCFSTGLSLTSSEVRKAMSIPSKKWEVQRSLLGLYKESKISRRQPTKKCAFIYYVAPENKAPEPVVYVDNPILDRPRKPLTFRYIFLAVFGLVGFGFLCGLMW